MIQTPDTAARQGKEPAPVEYSNKIYVILFYRFLIIKNPLSIALSSFGDVQTSK